MRRFDRDLEVAVEPGDRREGGAIRWRGPGGGSVGAQPVANAVEDDHLAVEVVEGAQAEVAVAKDVGDGGVAVVDAFEQCADRRELIHLVVMVLSSSVAAQWRKRSCAPVALFDAIASSHSKLSSCKCAARSTLRL